MKERRTTVTIPTVIDNIVYKHMEDTGIKTWNGAAWDLIRYAADAKAKEKRD